mmetsp:Transcript_2794/g.4778  ORF Transcript_2794/g.4778 Transcript_2794/m.4778 type:complete len:151 (-) Transcript_2794:511-963(-)
MSTTKISYRSVIEGSSEECIQSLAQVIKSDLKLCKDQIISISIHDSRIRHGDLEGVVFYREESLEADSEPLADTLTFQLIERDEDTSWDDILREVLLNSNQSAKQNLGIAATFRNVGEEKIACCFNIDSAPRTLFQQKFSGKCSWDELKD